MIPRQSTAFLAFSVVSWAAALVYGYSTGGDRLGPVLLGWWGGVGDHLGYAVLIGAALLFLLAATVTIVGRDGTDLTAEAQAQLGVAEVTPVEPASDALVYWPFVTAVGMAVIVVGVVVDYALFVLGLVIVLAAGLAWAESNSRERSRLLDAQPAEPLGAAAPRPLPAWAQGVLARVPAVAITLGFLSIVWGIFSNHEGGLGIVAGASVIAAGALASGFVNVDPERPSSETSTA